MYDLGLMNGEVYMDGVLKPLHVYVTDSKIVYMGPEVLDVKQIVECSGRWVLPGMIDPHVHMALDLGHITSCDDFESGSRAAIFGGVTTILDFLDPIKSVDDLSLAFNKRLREAQACACDFGFHTTLGDFQGDLKPLVALSKALGIESIKVFTAYKDSGRMLAKDQLEALLDQDILVMVHAEADHLVDEDWEDIASYGTSRPLASETEALQWLLDHQGKARLYVVHVSSGSGVHLLKDHEGVIIESCPHYFYLSDEVFSEDEGGLYLLAPPLRSQAEKEAINASFDRVHTIGTDHCPFLRADKLKTPMANKLPKGIGGIEHSFLLMFNKFGLEAIPKMSQEVAKHFGLLHKGRVAVGYDADLVIFDPEGHTLTTDQHGACDYTPYGEMRLKGRIMSTLIRGEWRLLDGYYIGGKGQYIRSETHASLD